MGVANTDAAVIPGKYSPSCYACVRSLKRRGIRTIVPSGYDDVPTFHSRYCDEQVTVPSPHVDLIEYRDAMLTLADRPDVKTIVPIFEEDAYLLSRYRDRFSESVDLAVPSLDALRLAYDRLRLVEVAQEAGVAAPDTTLLSEVEDWSDGQIVKSRYNLLTPDHFDEYSDSDAHMVKHLEYLDPGSKADVTEMTEKMRHEPIVQKFVPSNGQYVFGALYDHGEPVSTFQHRQIRGETYAGGGGSYRESVAIPKLERAGRNLLDQLEWHGLACIEFRKHTETGEFVLVELNPRAWRSMAIAVKSGADFPSHYWTLARGEDTPIDPSYKTDVGMHFAYGEFTYLKSVLTEDYPNVERPSLIKTIRDIVVSSITQPQFDYLSLDDPQPFVHGVLNSVR